MSRYTAHGKQVKDPSGTHFADAAETYGAMLITTAMNAMHRLTPDCDTCLDNGMTGGCVRCMRSAR